MTGAIAVHGRSTQFESALERDLLILLDFDPSVQSVLEQPLKISYSLRTYTPDFLITRTQTIPELCEVKYRADIKKDWKVLKPKFRAGRKFAKENGIKFRILTEVEIRTPFLQNVNFLRSYRNVAVQPYVDEHLCQTLRLLGTSTPDELLNAAFFLPEDRAHNLACLWKLLAGNHLVADLSMPLNMRSPIRIYQGKEKLWQHPLSSPSLRAK